MYCPFCSHEDSKVLDSRPSPEGKGIRRRRECLKCEKRWRTVERLEEQMPIVLKRDLSPQPFDREKLLMSFKISTGKRPVSSAQIEEAIADIEWKILESGKDEIASQEIGAMVMDALKQLDEISYVRYASVYRRFKDVGELMAEMHDLLQSPPP